MKNFCNKLVAFRLLIRYNFFKLLVPLQPQRNIMKAKYTILLIALGYCIEYIGSLSRIMHNSEAQTLLVIATILKVFGVIMFAFKVINYEGFRKFMER